MDQNKKDKVKDFFRKEGFYLILFICLCVVATIAVVTTKNNNTKEQANNPEQEFTLNVDEKNTSEAQKQNADRVQTEVEEEIAQAEEDVATEAATEEEVAVEEDVNVAAGTTTEVKFINPVDGEICRVYSYPQPKEMKDGTRRNIRGIDIGAKVGTEVKAAAVGEVKEVSNKSEEGNYVLIAHANGTSTKYCNLSDEILVKVGDKVTEETVIGAVGNSSKIFSNKEFGEHMNLQVQDSNGKDLDPTTYFTYKVKE